MDLYKFYGRKSLITSVSLGGLFITSNASAQFINWVPVNVAVPLSTTSTILLGLLLLAFGTFFAPKLKNKKRLFVIGSGLSLVLASGMSIVDNSVHAVTASQVSIVTPTGPSHLLQNRLSEVTNNFTEAVRITELNPEDCIFTTQGTTCSVGQVLQIGDSCLANVLCFTDSDDTETAR